MKIIPSEYQELAECFVGSNYAADVAKKMCVVLKKHNPNFNPKRFINACQGIKGNRNEHSAES